MSIFSDGVFGPTSGSYSIANSVYQGSGSVVTSAFLDQQAFGQAQNLPLTGGLLNASGYYLTFEDSITGNVRNVDTTLTVVPEPTNLFAFALTLCFGIGAVYFVRKNRTS